MSSPTPEERDSQLAVALSQAIKAHSKKHYNAGVAKGITLATDLLKGGLTSAEKTRLKEMFDRLASCAEDALRKSLDGKPRP